MRMEFVDLGQRRDDECAGKKSVALVEDVFAVRPVGIIDEKETQQMSASILAIIFGFFEIKL